MYVLFGYMDFVGLSQEPAEGKKPRRKKATVTSTGVLRPHLRVEGSGAVVWRKVPIKSTIHGTF